MPVKRLDAVPADGSAGPLAVPLDEIATEVVHSFRMHCGYCGPSAAMQAELGAPWMNDYVVSRLVVRAHCGRASVPASAGRAGLLNKPKDLV